MQPTEIVEAFVAAWNAMDLDRILEHLAEDVRYHNIPMAPLEGRAAVRDYLQRAWVFEAVDWRLVHIARHGNVVLTERVDAFVINGVDVTLPLMGVFEIENGKIAAWRDYFDLNMYLQQLHAAGVKGD